MASSARTSTLSWSSPKELAEPARDTSCALRSAWEVAAMAVSRWGRTEVRRLLRPEEEKRFARWVVREALSGVGGGVEARWREWEAVIFGPWW